jgi:hypothetical protein
MFYKLWINIARDRKDFLPTNKGILGTNDMPLSIPVSSILRGIFPSYDLVS